MSISSDNFVFSQLPYIIPEYAERCDGFRGLFTGNPSTMLYQKEAEENPDKPTEEVKQADKDSLADSEDEAEESNLFFNLENKKPIPDKFTELDRLAFVVRAIENDCAVVPVGAVKLSPAHELRFDQAFRGLTPQEANDIHNWQHFREPQTKEKMQAIQREEAVFHKAFLDGLHQDKPKGSWSCQCDDSRMNVTVRNLLWPGFIAYHEARTSVFGYSYFGSGLKNVELPFMLS